MSRCTNTGENKQKNPHKPNHKQNKWTNKQKPTKNKTFKHVNQISLLFTLWWYGNYFYFNSIKFLLLIKTIWSTMLRDQRILWSIFELLLGVRLIISISSCLYHISSPHLSLISWDKLLQNKLVRSFKNRYITKMEKGPKQNCY